MWHDTLALTITIDGTTVGDTTGTTNIIGATFGAGRTDWFDTLSPSSGSFTFDGAFTDLGLGTIAATIGTAVVVSITSDLWTGVVDTVSEDTDTSGHTTTTITAIDQVAMLGQARLEDEHLAADTLDDQLVDVFGFAGLTPTARYLPYGDWGLAVLADIDPLDGSVLDWMSGAEADSNSLIAVNGIGELLIQNRGHFGDYGDRALSDYYTTVTPDSFWRMRDSSGNIIDYIGAITGTAAGTPTYSQDGPWGASGPDSILFTSVGANDRFTMGDNYDLTGASWSIGAWIRCSSLSATMTVIGKLATGPNNGWFFQVLASGALRYTSYNAGAATTLDSAASTIAVNTWTHVAVMKSAGNVYIFKNGVQVATAAAGTVPNTAGTLTIGAVATTDWFDGRICMVGIWNGTSIGATGWLNLIYAGKIDVSDGTDNAPYSWTESTSITTVINHWIFRQFSLVDSYTDAGSIALYGDHTFEHSSEAATDLADLYTPDNRTALADPRPVATCSFHITSDDQINLATRAPLHYVIRDGVEWQVMQVSHSITPDSWDVTMNLSGTVAALTTGETLLPA